VLLYVLWGTPRGCRYCECFASGRYCDHCNCVNCCNNKDNESVRQSAVEAILERNPNAFRPKIQVRGWMVTASSYMSDAKDDVCCFLANLHPAGAGQLPVTSAATAVSIVCQHLSVCLPFVGGWHVRRPSSDPCAALKVQCVCVHVLSALHRLLMETLILRVCEMPQMEL